MTSASTINIAAMANVTRMPSATAPGLAVVKSSARVASAKIAPMTDAPVMRPSARAR